MILFDLYRQASLRLSRSLNRIPERKAPIIGQADLLPRSVRHLGDSVGFVVKEGNPGPKRIQRKRTRGWRMPEGAVYVGRPTLYANQVDWRKVGREQAVEDFRTILRHWQNDAPEDFEEILDQLRGHDLMCWCPLDQPCHADVWLDLANA